ncbi:hypothetical protein [Albibacterium profundi]|uniref:Uncharacterized protein n=1 Tax=Albibacterium profundi TaxID=3134906 RepID=A0ABV5CC82_9SPHI
MMGKIDVTGSSTVSVIHQKATHRVHARTALPCGDNPSKGIALISKNNSGPTMKLMVLICFLNKDPERAKIIISKLEAETELRKAAEEKKREAEEIRREAENL